MYVCSLVTKAIIASYYVPIYHDYEKFCGFC